MARFSKTAKPIVIAAAALLVLGGVLAVLLLTSPKEENDSQESSTVSETVNITNKTADNVVKLSVENKKGSFSLNRRQRTVTNTDEDGNTSESTEYYWTSDELKGVPQDDTAVLDMVSGLAAFSAKKTVEENAEDLEQYGLSQPLAKATIEFDDGTSAEFSFGNKNPVDDSGIYMLAGDNNNVLLAAYSAVEKVFSDVKDFAELLLTDSYSSGDNELEYLKIERQDMEQPVEIKYMSELDEANENEDLVVSSSNTHRFVSPITAELDYTNGKSLWYNLYGLTADSVAYTEQTAENLEKCGLSEPYAKVEFKYSGVERTLLLGSENEDKTGYYFTLSTVPGIYTISKDTAVWYTFGIGDVISRRPLSPYIYSLDTLEISTPEGEFIYNIDSENQTFTCNGEEIDSDNFRSFYRMLIGTIGEEYYTGEVDSDNPQVTVRFNYKSEYAGVYGRTQDTLEFFGNGDRKNIIKLNGDTLFKVSGIYTTRLIKNVDALLQGGEVNIDW